MSRPIVIRLARAVLAMALIAAPAATAVAQPDLPEDPPEEKKPQVPPKQITDDDMATAQRDNDRPWATGVSAKEQQTALILFNDGNKHLREGLFPKAIEKYKEALEHWDHPAIHYNLALALVNLDQPVEMHAALEKSMVYGADPLGSDKFDRAKDFKLLVEKQLANVEYTVSVAGSRLIFDGEEVLVGPGTWTALVRAGAHSVAAKADGYVPTQFDLKLGGGETSRLELKLFTDKDVTRERRRMPVWVPYAVLGAGAVIGGVGGLLHNQAKNGYADYDAAIGGCVDENTGGCVPNSATDAMLASADSRQLMAITAYAIGGAAIATGVALVFLNRPQQYRIDPLKDVRERVGVAPLVGPGLTGIVAVGRF